MDKAGIWKNGDVIGCGLRNDTIIFTRNGKVVWKRKNTFFDMRYVLHPTVGFHSNGERVQIKLVTDSGRVCLLFA